MSRVVKHHITGINESTMKLLHIVIYEQLFVEIIEQIAAQAAFFGQGIGRRFGGADGLEWKIIGAAEVGLCNA